MKDVSVDFIASEEATQREPAELYHIWRDDDSEHWYHTSGDVAIDYDGNTYIPGALKRTRVTYNATMDATTMTITSPALFDPTIEYIAQNPIDLLWVSVSKIHRGDLTEADVVFIGQVKEVKFKGIQGQVQCVGFEHFLKKRVPAWRYQLTCNHIVFDNKCSLVKTSYETSTIIALDATKKILTSSAFGTKDDGYFIGGEIIFGNESRACIAHEGNSITIMYKFIELQDGNTIKAYPGCDGRSETCRDKFNNINNNLGFPFIPLENPATRVSW